MNHLSFKLLALLFLLQNLCYAQELDVAWSKSIICNKESGNYHFKSFIGETEKLVYVLFKYEDEEYYRKYRDIKIIAFDKITMKEVYSVTKICPSEKKHITRQSMLINGEVYITWSQHISHFNSKLEQIGTDLKLNGDEKLGIFKNRQGINQPVLFKYEPYITHKKGLDLSIKLLSKDLEIEKSSMIKLPPMEKGFGVQGYGYRIFDSGNMILYYEPNKDKDGVYERYYHYINFLTEKVISKKVSSGENYSFYNTDFREYNNEVFIYGLYSSFSKKGNKPLLGIHLTRLNLLKPNLETKTKFKPFSQGHLTTLTPSVITKKNKILTVENFMLENVIIDKGNLSLICSNYLKHCPIAASGVETFPELNKLDIRIITVNTYDEIGKIHSIPRNYLWYTCRTELGVSVLSLKDGKYMLTYKDARGGKGPSTTLESCIFNSSTGKFEMGALQVVPELLKMKLKETKIIPDFHYTLGTQIGNTIYYHSEISTGGQYKTRYDPSVLFLGRINVKQ